MKILYLLILFFSILLLIGCQDNSITAPLTTEAVNKNHIPGPYQHGFISLEGMLSDPYPIGNSFYVINGQIEYEHRLVSQNHVSLNLVTNADFQYICTVCSPSQDDVHSAFISNDSEDYLLINEEFIILEKTFIIQGREDGMVLKCRFRVSTSTMELNAMWLALPDQDVVAADKTSN